MYIVQVRSYFGSSSFSAFIRKPIAMEVDVLTLVEMRYDKQALASYEAA